LCLVKDKLLILCPLPTFLISSSSQVHSADVQLCGSHAAHSALLARKLFPFSHYTRYILVYIPIFSNSTQLISFFFLSKVTLVQPREGTIISRLSEIEGKLDCFIVTSHNTTGRRENKKK